MWDFLMVFSKHRPSWPMLSISGSAHMCVCLCVCLCVCSLLRYRLNIFLPPLPERGSQKYLEILNPWGKIMEKVVSHWKTFTNNGCKIAERKKFFFFLTNFSLIKNLSICQSSQDCYGIRRLYNKDQEVIQQGSGGYKKRIRRLYNKDQVVI